MRVVTYLRARLDDYDTQVALDGVEELARRRKLRVVESFLEPIQSVKTGGETQWAKLLRGKRTKRYQGVLIHSLGDLGGDLPTIIQKMDALNRAKLHLVVVTEPRFDTTTKLGVTLIGLTSVLWEWQRAKDRAARRKLKLRSRAGGQNLGRPRVEVDLNEVERRLANLESIPTIAKKMKVSVSTLRRRIKAEGLLPPTSL